MNKGSITQRFLFTNKAIRGEYLTLDKQWQTILQQQNYPETVRQLLGEALACAIMLSSTLKYQGRLTLQIQNPEAPVSLLLVQVNTNHHFRATASWHKNLQPGPLAELFGNSPMVITLEQNQQSHQALVELRGNHIRSAMEHYFSHSEQLDTLIHISSNKQQLGGLLLQKLPDKHPQAAQHDWEEIKLLAQTLKENELLAWDAPTLLHKLFSEEDIQLFDPQPWHFQCTCSADKVKQMVRSLGKEEAEKLLQEKGNISVDCEFCHHHYQLDAIDIATLFQAEMTTSRQLH